MQKLLGSIIIYYFVFLAARLYVTQKTNIVYF